MVPKKNQQPHSLCTNLFFLYHSSLSILFFNSLEHRYEELIAQRGILKGLANKSKYKQNQIEIQDVSRALRESTKNLCRNLKDNPNISGNLMKIQKEREGLEGTFFFLNSLFQLNNPRHLFLQTLGLLGPTLGHS